MLVFKTYDMHDNVHFCKSFVNGMEDIYTGEIIKEWKREKGIIIEFPKGNPIFHVVDDDNRYHKCVWNPDEYVFVDYENDSSIELNYVRRIFREEVRLKEVYSTVTE